ncbi:MAG: LysM peptidoglycan-binding domain-containing protein [Anaerolineae bacterium]
MLIGLLLLSSLAACSKEQDPTPAASVSTSPSTNPVKDAEAESPTVATGSVVGLADAGSQPMPTPPPQVYTVQAGDTLSSISRKFGIDLDELIAINGITNPNLLQVGQQLQVPASQMETGPDLRLLPNSEFVNGPAYVDFDIAAFIIQNGGYLLSYEENVGGRVMNGPEIVDYVVDHYSVGPRMLLAILELQSGWVTNPNPSGEALLYPMGYTGSGWDLLQRQLAWAADRLNQGYYDWRGRGMPIKSWGDGTSMVYAPTLNAATAGLQSFFSLVATKSEWQVLVGDGPGSFLQTYRQLFGDPNQYAIEPLIPASTSIPDLSLPWAQGEMWYYTGGPHGGWADGSAWSAIDFVPDEGYLGCQAAASWATAAAPGLVTHSENGEVMVDLDQDGHDETGWVLFYLHVASQGRVPVGTQVKQGDSIGHPSCEGGFSESTHLHLARKYNGEWIAADGPLPLVLSGWQFYSSGASYEGTASRGAQERTACECRQPDFNGLVADR